MAPRSPVPRGGSAIRQANLREHNLSLVLRLIVEAAAAPSRADIAATTGLTRATVSSLVDALIEAGLVTELPPVMSQRAGRPAVPLVPAAGTVAAVGMEVNVDYLGVRMVDLSGAVLAQEICDGDFRGSDPARVVPALAGLYRAVVDTVIGATDRPARLAGTGLALPGLVDRTAGPVRLAPNLGWRAVDVAGLFRAAVDPAGRPYGPATPGRLDRPILLDNEATLAARAECDALRGLGVRTFLYLSGEVGVGGALVLDGAVFGGRHGWSGEIGHTVIDPDGPQCRCGATGCLEQYAGKDALMRAAGLDLSLPIDHLQRAAAAGDPAAVTSFAVAARALGTAIANAVNLVDVETVVLGGLYATLAGELVPGIERVLDQRVLAAPWSAIRVRSAVVREAAAMTGAASAVLTQVIDHPSEWMPRP
ncbi:ROK family protein [Nakamurella sp.]|uniref:ROK family protein n=1 Tax=Nakamurella sp. TaxID=1869182 RepID=UPI003B3ACB85